MLLENGTQPMGGNLNKIQHKLTVFTKKINHNKGYKQLKDYFKK